MNNLLRQVILVILSILCIQLIWYSFGNLINYFNLVIVGMLIYNFFNHSLFKKNYVNKKSIVISIILGIITVIGIGYSLSDSIISLLTNPMDLFKVLIIFFSYVIMFYSIIIKIREIDIDRIFINDSKVLSFYTKHFVLITILILLLCWLPYIVIYYPGGATGDTSDSIFQFFHSNKSWNLDTINLLDKNIYINKHHSVLFTVLLGNFIKLGNLFVSNDFGLFLFVIFQVIVLLIIFGYMFNYLKELNIPIWIIISLMIYFCGSVIIAKYSVTLVKDTLSSAFTLLYVIFLHQIVSNYNAFFENKKKILLLIITMLLVMMFRNNGIITIIFSFPFLVFIYKKKRIINIFLLVLIIFVSYNNYLLPSLGVSNGSIKEVLTVPFMQLARTVKYKGNSFTDLEKERINKVCDFGLLGIVYNPDLADNVKDSYKKGATASDLYNLFLIWEKYLVKYPYIYIESFINSTYGYFYLPYDKIEIKIYTNNSLYEQDDVKFVRVKSLENIKEVSNQYLKNTKKNLFITFFNNVGINVLLLIFSSGYVIYKKRYRYLIPLSPLIITLLVCLLSPVNGSYRYTLSIFYSIPIIVLIIYSLRRNLYG